MHCIWVCKDLNSTSVLKGILVAVRLRKGLAHEQNSSLYYIRAVFKCSSRAFRASKSGNRKSMRWMCHIVTDRVHKRKRKPKANSMAKTDTQTDLQYTLHALKGTSYSRSSLQKRKPMIRNYAFTI